MKFQIHHISSLLFSAQFSVVVRCYICDRDTCVLLMDNEGISEDLADSGADESETDCVLLMNNEGISEDSADSRADGSDTEWEGLCSRKYQAVPGLPVQETVCLDSPVHLRSVLWKEKERPLFHEDQKMVRSFRSLPFSPLGCRPTADQHGVAIGHPSGRRMRYERGSSRSTTVP